MNIWKKIRKIFSKGKRVEKKTSHGGRAEI